MRAVVAPRSVLKTLVKCDWVWNPTDSADIHQRQAGSDEHLLSPLDPAAQEVFVGPQTVAALNCAAKCMRVRPADEATSARLTGLSRLVST